MGGKGRGLMISFGALALLGVCIWLASSLSSSSLGRTKPDPGTIYNVNQSGLAAMYDWLKELGYETTSLEYVEWKLDDEADILVIAMPEDVITVNELDEILRWVSQGKTLIVVDNRINRVFDHYDIDFTMFETPTDKVAAHQPLANLPVSEIDANTIDGFEASVVHPAMQYEAFDLRKSDVLPLFGPADKAFVGAITEGAGIVYVVASADIVSNKGLLDSGNASLVLNMIDRHTAGSTVMFDEIHHGLQLKPAPPKKEYFSPLITAFVYMALVIIVWGFFNGRPFGSPITMFSNKQSRSSAEYIQSMAGLFQRGQQTGYIIKHYKHVFKRRIAKPYGVNPRLEDPLFIEELNRFVRIDQARLAGILQALSSQKPTEQSLRQIIQLADTYVQDVEDRR